MQFIAEYNTAVLKLDIPKLSHSMQLRIERAIREKLTTHPLEFAVPLRNTLKGYRKLRVGDYRIIFRILPKSIIYVIAICHRKNSYDIAQKRVQ